MDSPHRFDAIRTGADSQPGTIPDRFDVSVTGVRIFEDEAMDQPLRQPARSM
jgi:hypothetical protein